MADNICGPSNGAKNLVRHAEGDRSLHQDRVVTGPSRGTTGSFRSGNGRVSGADHAFKSFQYGNNVSGYDDHLLGPPNGHVAADIVQPPQLFHGGRVASFRTSTSPEIAVLSRPNMWSQEFTQSQINGFATSSATGPDIAALVHAGQYSPRTAFRGGMGTPLAAPSMATRDSSLLNKDYSFGILSSPSSTFIAGHCASPYRPHMQQLSTHPADTIATTGPAVDGSVTLMTADAAARSSQEDQAFNDAFKAFDDYEFQHEMAQWMARHGPGTAAHAEPFPAEDQDLQQLAKELETRLTADDASVLAQEREEGDEFAQQHGLAKAAQSILDTVADDENPKFKKSVFMSTMRRIAAYEVLAKGNDLVDANTGDSLVTDVNFDEETEEGPKEHVAAIG